ncbi:hypothetical protein POUND7_011546 [Theobroma cacao]
MESIASLPKRPKLPIPSNDVDPIDHGNKSMNDLPEPVVHHIFSFLETIDVIRASAVSTKWRYLWTSMPHLNFDYQAGWLNPLRQEFSSTRVYEKFKDFINWVLMAHDKSVNIQSFRLSCLNNDDDRSLYRWIKILAQKHVKELHLKVKSYKRGPFALPRYLLAPDSLEILELDLQRSVLKIPSDVGFSRLKSLQLVRTQLLDQNLFHNFISSCPLLENLRLEGCLFHDFKVLDISLRNLRKLFIDNDMCGGSFDERLRKCVFKIACPNLGYFHLSDPFAQNFSWDKIPSLLQTATILPWGWEDAVLHEELANYLLKLLRGVCHAEVLKLGKCILEHLYPAVAEPRCFSTTFYNLKSLKLFTGIDKCYIRSVIYLLKCAPNLQLLSVYIDEEEYDCDYQWEIPDEAIACLTDHLKMVKLIEVDNSDYELELIRFLLKNGHVLEKMSIIWPSDLQRETQMEAIQEIMKFPRSSSNVTVTFSELKESDYDDVL